MMMVIIVVIVIFEPIIESGFLEFFGHWRKGHTLWQVWKRIYEFSLLLVVVVEGTAFSEFTGTSLNPELTWNSFVV